ncbi:MAG: flagellar basal body-associated FliL family protein [Actinobacteria bacterium]|nr:flagellar basal body-associated FliL family protein [Actinomycetota bacterium]
MPERIVNLAPGGAQSYIKVKVSLEVKAEKAEAGGHGGKKDPYAHQREEITKLMPIIEDRINTSLSSRTSTDLASAEGKEDLKQEILTHAASVLGHELPVTFVYFNQFVMQ